MVDVHDFHAFDQRRTISPLHVDDVLILQGNAVRISGFQDAIPVAGFTRLAIHQYLKLAVGFLLHGKLLVRQQRSHTEFGDRREDALPAFQGYFTLGFPAQLIRQHSGHLITHGV